MALEGEFYGEEGAQPIAEVGGFLKLDRLVVVEDLAVVFHKESADFRAEEVEIGFAEGVGSFDGGELFPLSVDEQVSPRIVFDEDAGRSVFEERFEPCFGILEFFFRFGDFGDVAKEGADAVFPDVHGGDVKHAVDPVFFIGEDAFFEAGEAFGGGAVGVGRFGFDEGGEGFFDGSADEGLVVDAQDAVGGFVGADEFERIGFV